MRVCQPAPVALNLSTMSRSSRSVTDTLRSDFGGLPSWRTMPGTGLERSGAASGSTAMPRAIFASSLAVGRTSFPLIKSNLTTVGPSGGNDAALAATLDKHDNVQAHAQRRHRDESHLAVILATILENQRPFPVQAFKVAKVDPMLGQVGEPLALVPGRHEFS